MNRFRGRAIRGLGALLVACATADATPVGFQLRGKEILKPDGDPIVVRGFNACWWVPPTADDARNMKALGANCVRYMFGYEPDGAFDPSDLDYLPAQVAAFAAEGLWIIPVAYIQKKGRHIWVTPDMQREFLDMWDWVIARIGDNPRIAAWEPVNEPHDISDEDLRTWYDAVVAHFRRLDPSRPIVVEGSGYSWPWNLVDALKLDDTNIIYSFHTYGPYEYTHQKEGGNIAYPGKWSRSDLAEPIAKAVAFREKFNVPVLCGEWGVKTGNPGYQEWLRDVASILEEYELPWLHWAWALKPGDPRDASFDCNPQKVGIYETMKEIFKSALQPE